MTCPYCHTKIYALTGLREAWKFMKHLNRCKQRPMRIVRSDGKRVWVEPRHFNLEDALRIRAESGQ